MSVFTERVEQLLRWANKSQPATAPEIPQDRFQARLRVKWNRTLDKLRDSGRRSVVPLLEEIGKRTGFKVHTAFPRAEDGNFHGLFRTKRYGVSRTLFDSNGDVFGEMDEVPYVKYSLIVNRRDDDKSNGIEVICATDKRRQIIAKTSVRIGDTVIRVDNNDIRVFEETEQAITDALRLCLAVRQ